MSRFSINTDDLRKASARCVWISNGIYNLSGQIENVRSSLTYDMGNYSGVLEALDSCSVNARRCGDKVSYYGDSGKNIAGKYDDAENAIIWNMDMDLGNLVGFLFHRVTTNFVSFDMAGGIKKIVTGSLGKLGNIGGGLGLGIDLLYEYFKESDPRARGYNMTKVAVKDILKKVGENIKEPQGIKIRWEKLVEMKDVSKLGADAWKNYSDFSSVRNGAATACNWAAELAYSGIDNYKEHGGFTTRWAGETITEAGLTIGETVLASAATGAILATVGVAAAPAIVTVAATTAVVVGLDFIGNNVVSFLTNGAETSWKEWASDRINDFGEAVADKAKEVGKAVAEGAKEVGKAVQKGAEAVGNAISDGAKSVGKGAKKAWDCVCGWGKMAFGF